MGGFRRSAEEAAYAQLLQSRDSDRLYSRLDPYQKQFFADMQTFKVVFVDAPAGTGKTTVAVLAGLDGLRRQVYSQLVYVRFPSARGERLGATPGTLEEKEAKYMLPFVEAVEACGIQEDALWQLARQGIIKMTTDTSLRGVNFRNSFIIIDEAQNAEDLNQLRLVLTRVHDDGRTVVIGHSGQLDSRVKTYGASGETAFQLYMRHMTKKSWATVSTLVRNYRGSVAQWADRVEESIE